jgi:hypothetical protein
VRPSALFMPWFVFMASAAFLKASFVLPLPVS